jgi:hypothetical protein
MGIISFSYNTDKNSVKRSMNWLIDLVIGGSDNTEGEAIQSKIHSEKLKKGNFSRKKVASKDQKFEEAK